MTLDQELEARRKAKEKMYRGPWREGDASVYSPYSDRQLWINPYCIKKYGSTKEAIDHILSADKAMLLMMTKMTSETDDFVTLTAIEDQGSKEGAK
jgi:hypothetical protein